MVRLQSGAGVEVLHHDLRTAPESMTAKALAKAGTAAPTSSYAGKRSGHGGPRKPYRGQSGGRPTGGHGRSGSSYGKGRPSYGRKPAAR